jgi:hypothetical protein
MFRFGFATRVALAVLVVLGFAFPVAAREQVPFRGSYEGVVTRGELAFPFVSVLVEAEGNATHLGRFTVSHPHVVNVVNSTALGTYEFTAANGDTLTADVVGQATPIGGGILLIEEQVTITGGTGRFAGATGSFTVERWYDTVANTTYAEFEGTISNPGGQD